MKASEQIQAKAEVLFEEAERLNEAGNPKLAFERYHASAKLGFPLAYVNVGNFYSWGRGVKRSLEKAAYWYKRAYKYGHADGALNLAIDYRNSGNMRAATVWFKKAIALNCGDAFIELAKLYSSVDRTRPIAAALLQKAIGLSCDDISELSRDAAQTLLQQLKTIGPIQAVRGGARR